MARLFEIVIDFHRCFALVYWLTKSTTSLDPFWMLTSRTCLVLLRPTCAYKSPHLITDQCLMIFPDFFRFISVPSLFPFDFCFSCNIFAVDVFGGHFKNLLRRFSVAHCDQNFFFQLQINRRDYKNSNLVLTFNFVLRCQFIILEAQGFLSTSSVFHFRQVRQLLSLKRKSLIFSVLTDLLSHCRTLTTVLQKHIEMSDKSDRNIEVKRDRLIRYFKVIGFQYFFSIHFDERLKLE